jgi:hypothetical protein
MSAAKLRKQDGRYTEPVMPPRTILVEEGVTIENYYCSQGDHAPPHLHVSGKGEEVRIGQNGRPLEWDPPLSRDQKEVVARNIRIIRKSIRKIGRWYWFHAVLESRRGGPPGR